MKKQDSKSAKTAVQRAKACVRALEGALSQRSASDKAVQGGMRANEVAEKDKYGNEVVGYFVMKALNAV